ncbi:glycosyltransferase [Rhodococcus sp. PAMC28707]|nr:glycosyltransferase [Rhodococcus sp. PAMC28705]QCB58395.1 glycosyltransferase [Rhodococcus sp. PAMC28707]
MSEFYKPLLERIPVGKVAFDQFNMESAANLVKELAIAKVGVAIRLSNAYCVAMAASDPEYCALLNGPGINLADGSPVAWLLKRVSINPAAVGRVRGPSLFVKILDEGRAVGLRHYFLGSTEDNLQRIETRSTIELPGISIAGSYSPPFGPLNQAFYDTCVSKVRKSGANILWVGLGSPKQDYACAILAYELGIPCLGVGAAFDFYAGTVREAPVFLQRYGLEWIYRLASEPRRLWRRYVFGNVQFGISVLREFRRSEK